MAKDKVLLLGTLPPPLQGQPIAFESAFFALKNSYDCKVLETSFRGDSVLSKLKKIVNYFVKLPVYVFFFKPDVVYFLCSRSLIGGFRDVYLLSIIYFTRIKVCNHLHGSDFKEYLDSLPFVYRFFVTKLFDRVDKHAVLLEGMKEQVTQFKGSVSVIPNFFSSVKGKECSLEIKQDNGKMVVFYLSSIVKSKGIFELISSIKEINKEMDVATLYIAGGFLGDEFMEKEDVKHTFFSEIIGDSNIVYLGVLNMEEKYKYLDYSDVFVLPTYYRSEAFPLSIIEAMASSCSIVCSDYKYLPEIIKDNVNGLLVEPRSTSDLVNKISYISSNEDVNNAFKLKNKEIAYSLYSESRYQKNIVKFVKE